MSSYLNVLVRISLLDCSWLPIGSYRMVIPGIIRSHGFDATIVYYMRNEIPIGGVYQYPVWYQFLTEVVQNSFKIRRRGCEFWEG